MTRRILVVCTANQCRSPMAEGLLRAAIERHGAGDRLDVGSAGTWAIEDVPATPHAVAVMRARGIDIAGHRSRAVDADLLAWADVVLVMAEGHREALEAEFPEVAPRLHLFSALGGERHDIEDPVGGPIAAYELTARQLEDFIESGWDLLVASGRRRSPADE